MVALKADKQQFKAAQKLVAANAIRILSMQPQLANQQFGDDGEQLQRSKNELPHTHRMTSNTLQSGK